MQTGRQFLHSPFPLQNPCNSVENNKTPLVILITFNNYLRIQPFPVTRFKRQKKKEI